MDTIKAIIVEDIIDHANTLQEYLNIVCPEVHVIATCATLTEAFSTIKSTAPNLVFLDIEIGREKGFTLLEYLTDLDFEVIFVTAFDDYRPHSFEFPALDYILKPFSKTDLREAVNRIHKGEGKLAFKRRLSIYFQNLRESESANMIFVISEKGKPQEEVHFKDICRVMGAGSYSVIHLLNPPRQKIVSKNIGAISEVFPGDIFFRIGKSHLVNAYLVRDLEYHGRSGSAVLFDGTKVPIASRKLGIFHNFITNLKIQRP